MNATGLPRWMSVAECDGAVVTDPLPHWNGAAQFGGCEQLMLVELPGVEADRADQVASACLGIPVDQFDQGRAALARDRGGDPVQRETRRLLGQEHQRRAALLGRADGDQERHSDPLGVLQPSGQAGNSPSGHSCLLSWIGLDAGRLWSGAVADMRGSTGFQPARKPRRSRMFAVGRQGVCCRPGTSILFRGPTAGMDEKQLIGREPEQTRLDAWAAEARAGRGSLVLAAGEAGVRKAGLARLVLGGSGLGVLEGVAGEQGAGAYGPVIAALRSYLRSEGGGLPIRGPLAQHLALLLPELGFTPAPGDRVTLLEAIRSALAGIAARRPAAVFLDDLHQADDATLELIAALARSIEHEPLLILGAYRSDEIPRAHPIRRMRSELRRARHLREIAVEPLDAEAGAALLERVLGAVAAPSLRRAVFDRTDGVPFFIEELGLALAASRRLQQGPLGLELLEGKDLPLPENVRDAVLLRADRLSDEDRGARCRAGVRSRAGGHHRGTRRVAGRVGSSRRRARGRAWEHGVPARPHPGRLLRRGAMDPAGGPAPGRRRAAAGGWSTSRSGGRAVGTGTRARSGSLVVPGGRGSVLCRSRLPRRGARHQQGAGAVARGAGRARPAGCPGASRPRRGAGR